MRPDRAQAMRDARRLDGRRKHALVLAATTAALQAGRQPTIAAIARAAGVGRKFIYDHGDLRAEIELKAAQATQRQANDMIASARVTGGRYEPTWRTAKPSTAASKARFGRSSNASPTQKAPG